MHNRTRIKKKKKRINIVAVAPADWTDLNIFDPPYNRNRIERSTTDSTQWINGPL